MAESPDVVMQRLHDEHGGALWGHCLRLTNHDRARAEDVCQETLLRAWRNASLLDESQGSVRAWLFTVARNIVIDESRTKRARSEFPVDEVPEPPRADDKSDELLLTWVVADAVTHLSAEQRGTVKSRTHYALRALRLALEEMGVVS